MRSRRLGIKTIRASAYKICQVYTKFAPTIGLVITTNPALLVALEALNQACIEVIAQIDSATEFEG